MRIFLSSMLLTIKVLSSAEEDSPTFIIKLNSEMGFSEPRPDTIFSESIIEDSANFNESFECSVDAPKT
jgi:hypothetical protein